MWISSFNNKYISFLENSFLRGRESMISSRSKEAMKAGGDTVCEFILTCKARERQTIWKWKLNWHRLILATNQRAQTIQKLPNIDGRVWKSNDGVLCHIRHSETECENNGQVGVSVIFSMFSPQESPGEWIANGDEESHKREEKVTISVVNVRVSVGMHYKLYKTGWHVFHVVVWIKRSQSKEINACSTIDHLNGEKLGREITKIYIPSWTKNIEHSRFSLYYGILPMARRRSSLRRTSPKFGGTSGKV